MATSVGIVPQNSNEYLDSYYTNYYKKPIINNQQIFKEELKNNEEEINNSEKEVNNNEGKIIVQNVEEKKEKKKFNDSFVKYSLQASADIILAVVLGIGVNVVADFFISQFNLSLYAGIILQIFLIIVVLYFMKVISNKLYSSWNGHSQYGIMFMVFFFATQKNVINFFRNIYD